MANILEESPFKADILKGKVAFISGGGSGIGFAIAMTLGKHGCKVGIMGRRKHVLDKAVLELEKAGIEAVAAPGDVRKYEVCQQAVATTVAKFEKIDILVNGAGGNFLITPEDLTPNGFKTVIEIDTIGTFHTCKAAFEELKKTKGIIINLSATMQINAMRFQIHASAAKAAIDSLTRSLALEWAKYGIRTVGVAPGATEGTPGADILGGGKPADEYAKAVPLGSGHTIIVDGGAAVFDYFCFRGSVRYLDCPAESETVATYNSPQG